MAGEWEYEIVVHKIGMAEDDPSPIRHNQAMIVRRRAPNSGGVPDFARGRVGERVTPWEEFCWADRSGAQQVLERLRLAEITPEKIQSPADVNLMKENERLVEEVATRDQELREMQALINDTNARMLGLEGKVGEVVEINAALEEDQMEYERRIAVLDEYSTACIKLLQNYGSGVPDLASIRSVVERKFNAEWKAEHG